MGIKGIYRELGSGQRISLGKLATEHLEKTGRPLRLAIDVAIWQFQTQAAKGGTNPAIRTLFYRLVRLLGLPIQPVFVFDGPHKPAFKRNKRSGQGDGVANAMAKRVIGLFGFPFHQAPGEAEAECAFMQQKGLVDAVLSEDVDTIMFGCHKTLRSWTAEGTRGSKTPTHVTMYDLNDKTSVAYALGREGMVLVAVMSGGDYLPEGIPGCGVKLACEAAKAGFGKSLCRLKLSDEDSLAEWKADLEHELRTNQRGFFRTRHKALEIPHDFPNMQVLRHYTHPVVSSEDALRKRWSEISWTTNVNLGGLRSFAEETFDWTFRIGAIKFIRVLSPSLLARRLLDRPTSSSSQQEDEPLVHGVTNRRTHFSVDGLPELRVSHIPLDVVPLDLSQELEETISTDRQGLALNSDRECDEQDDNIIEEETSQKDKATFDPSKPAPLWMFESLIRLAAPSAVEEFEEKQRKKATSKQATKTSKKTKVAKQKDSQHGALDRWVQVTKSSSQPAVFKQPERPELPSALRSSSPARLLSTTSGRSAQTRPFSTSSDAYRPRQPQQSVNGSKPPKPTQSARAAKAALPPQNPWAASGSQFTPRTTKSGRHAETILLSSSPESHPSSPAARPVTKGSRSKASKETFHPDTWKTASRGAHRSQEEEEEEEEGMPPLALEPSPSPRKKAEAAAGRVMTQTSITAFIKSIADETPQKSPGHAAIGSQTADEALGSSSFCSASSARHSTSLSPKAPFVETHPDIGRDSSPTPRSRHPAEPRLEEASLPGGLHTGTKQKKKVYVPRVSAVGFFKEVEVSVDEVENLTTGTESRPATKRHGRKAWRQSDISVIDLTGDDS